MEEKLQQQTQKQAKEAKSCIKVQNEKAIVHNRQIVFKSQTKPENKNCQNFVTLNKRKTTKKLDGKMLENIKEFENQGLVNLLECPCFVHCMVFIILLKK